MHLLGAELFQTICQSVNMCDINEQFTERSSCHVQGFMSNLEVLLDCAAMLQDIGNFQKRSPYL
jgi:hypothetical protein